MTSDEGGGLQRALDREVIAIYSKLSPLEDMNSPYHAFARCPPTALFGKPRLWPGPEGYATTARLLWNETELYVCWELEGPASAPILETQVEASCLEEFYEGAIQAGQRTVLLDERVECFLWQPADELSADEPPAKRRKPESSGQLYYAFEVNHKGNALTGRARFGGDKGFEWPSRSAYAIWTDELSIGWGATASAIPSAEAGLISPFKRVVIGAFKWAPMDIDTGRDIRIGLFRASYPAPLHLDPAKKMGKAEVDELLSKMVWTSWVDPGDAEVNFHRPVCFGKLVLAPAGFKTDCFCSAIRLVRPRTLRLLCSPKPSLAECPDGSVLVRAQYASICGSDMPYMKSSKMMAPSLYWDRDGFCGHEAVGIIMDSKSKKFSIGDAVMALPSSYFKAHVGSKQEWYRDEVHGVLLTDFPVRGGFSQMFTGHELYCYKIKECVPHALAAQALGTVLKLAKRIGSVIGKTVVVLGQGQNGLIATRLMAQLCAKTLIAVEPLEYRRAISKKFGAHHALAPADALSFILEATGGRGADVVLEMVGHNQDTINEALDYVACSGIVAAFGVPDDQLYDHFEFSKFFRKNVRLIASVIPDPGADFLEAVELIERGQFSTDGMFTHFLPIAELEKAFKIASEYLDGVVKLVLDLR